MSKIQTNIGFKETTEYQLRDSEGKIKPLFQPNKLYLFLLNRGWISPKIHCRLLGRFADKMVIKNK